MAVGFFGDGAVHVGSFHEGMNLAALWDLPVVFVCENNRYAAEVPLSATTKNMDIASRDEDYGMHGIAVDGMDVLTVHAAAGEAIVRARTGSGPALLVADTYRYMGHYSGDPGTGYRPDDEIETMQARDPLIKLRSEMLANGDATDETFGAIEAEVAETVRDAVDFADTSEWPEMTPAESGVFATPVNA